jgi:hypothetical protein
MQVGSSLTDVGGNFNVAGTASFIGRSAKLDDKCGDASLSLNGDINWGTSDGTDCKFNAPQFRCMSFLLLISLTSIFRCQFSLQRLTR